MVCVVVCVVGWCTRYGATLPPCPPMVVALCVYPYPPPLIVPLALICLCVVCVGVGWAPYSTLPYAWPLPPSIGLLVALCGVRPMYGP